MSLLTIIQGGLGMTFDFWAQDRRHRDGQRLPLSAFSLLLLSALVMPGPALAETVTQEKQRPAKDMRYRKRVIVAPTGAEIPRRIDYQSLGTRDTLLLPKYRPSYGQQNFDSAAQANGQSQYRSVGTDDGGLSAGAGQSNLVPGSSSLPRANRNGIVPPPPPAQSNLLPRSLTTSTDTGAVAQSATARSIDPPSRTNVHVPLSANRINQIKNDANLLAKKGKLHEAQALLEKYSREYPQDVALKTELAKINLARAKNYSKAGDHALAAKHARLAVANAKAAPEIGASAESTLHSSIAKLGVNPKNAEQRKVLGDKLSAQNRHSEALVEYQAAAKLSPSVANHVSVGNAAAMSGQHMEAKAAYQEALELNPDSSSALRQLGMTRLKLRDYTGASADLTRALILDQSDKVAANALIGQWREQVASRPSDPNSHLGLARALQVAGDLTAAQAEYKTVVQLNPSHPHLPAARQSFKLALAKQEAKKAYDLAQSLEKEGALSAAYQKASDAVGLYPSDKNYKAYWETLGEKIRAQGIPAAPPPLSPEAAAQLAALAQPGEQPPQASLPTAQNLGLAQTPAAQQAQFAGENGYRPMNTDTQVSSISNFLSTMRDFTVQQQNQIDATSKATREALKSLGTGGAVPAIEATASSTTTTTATATAATADEALASATQALANTTGGIAAAAPAAQATTPMSLTGLAMGARDAATSGGGSTLGNMMNYGSTTMPALSTGRFKMINQSDVSSILQKAGNRFTQAPAGSEQTALGAYPAPAVNALSPQVAPLAPQGAPQAMTQSMPQTMSQAMPQATPQNGLYDNNQSAINNPSSPFGATQSQANQGDQMIQSMRQAAPQKYLNENTPGEQAVATNLPPSASAAPLALKPALPIPQTSARLYLAGVKAGKNDVQLKVLLRNDGATAIKLPGTTDGVLRSNGKADQSIKVSFGSRNLSVGGSVSGTITVPGASLDPSADIFIPGQNIANANLSDLHLTVPISQKNRSRKNEASQYKSAEL
ncbi:MAG: tetratricopeptide repeat protein [Candidatus Obscuribacter sp.]|nr:tetratricopeptide repeat protein [Candidatus Obscuribacter sp.]